MLDELSAIAFLVILFSFLRRMAKMAESIEKNKARISYLTEPCVCGHERMFHVHKVGAVNNVQWTSHTHGRCSQCAQGKSTGCSHFRTVLTGV
jgi:D-arabinose 1-dehydrogenase-like Zn-dependent alcohol dehydrogenase